MEENDLTKEFLIESNENLGRLDQEMVQLEQRPKDATLLASIFRTIHTLKGTCGFLGFSTIEAITHQAETILGQVREGGRELTPDLVSLILKTVDAVKVELEAIELTNKESGEPHQELIQSLSAAAERRKVPGPASAESPVVPPPATTEAPMPARAAARAEAERSSTVRS